MTDLPSKITRKGTRKQKRAHHRLLRDANIKTSEEPTKFLMICNAGLVTGFDKDILESIVAPLVNRYELIMPLNRSYCFIVCSSEEDSMTLYNKIHGHIRPENQSTPLYMTYTESVPDLNIHSQSSELPPGLKLIENFITVEKELILLNLVNWDEKGAFSSDLKNRKAKHFGYEFQFGSNIVDPNNPITPIPEECNFLQSLFKQHCFVTYNFDQLTINRYLPGQGIPSHIDTHSCFEDTILSLSLGSLCVMRFKKEDHHIDILLSPRSLLVMSDESRYAWSHGISPKYVDTLQTNDGIKRQARGLRISYTFRKVRNRPCACKFAKYCDVTRNSFITIDNKAGAELEKSYVHKVYEEISEHFSETRSKQWPNVIGFLKNLKKGSLIIDVGCGNGKYLHIDRDNFKIGCDRSSNLAKICRDKNFEVLLSDCLYLPYRNNSVDATISIAVIHHLSTIERRKQAISEMIRVLRPSGKCLIYVWAKEQNKNSVQSNYLKYNQNKREEEDNDERVLQIKERHLILPVHKNRTEFTHSDMLVPWKKKTGDNFFRYYHLFEEGELTKLCSEIPSVVIESSYYDQGNWCIILQKIQKQ